MPKPAYRAALALQTALGERAVLGRASAANSSTSGASADPDAYVVRFEGGALAAWHVGGRRLPPSAAGACASDVSLRDDCGHQGTTHAECSAAGCCWLAEDEFGPQCFHPRRDADATLYFAPGAEADAGVGAGGAAGGAAGACWTVLDVMGELHGEPVCRGEDGRLALKVNDSPRYLLPAARIVT